MASQFDDILTKYRKVQPTGEEGAPTANQLQPAGTGPMGLDAILKKYEQPSTLSDIGQTIVGLPRTGAEMLSGMPGGLEQMFAYIAGKGMDATGIWTPEEMAAKRAQWEQERHWASPGDVRQTNTELLDAAGLPKGIEEASRYQPKTRGGQVAQTIGLLAPGLISGGGSLTANLISRVGIPAGMIEGGAEVGKAYGDETMGRMLGGLGAMAAPATWNRMSRPYPAEPGRQPLRNVLDRERVPYTAGQATGNDRLLYRESVAGEMPAIQEQGPAFVEATTRTQGGFPRGTNTLSRDAMGDELGRMGTEFDRMAALSNAPYTTQMLDDMTAVVQSYRENPIVGGRVERVVNDLFDNAQQQGGRITGEGYKDTNSKLSDIIRNTADDAEREAMIAVKNILDDAVEAGLPPAEQGSWRTVRQQYRDYLPIEKAKAQSSPTAARGIITPSALRTGIRSVEGTREVASGNRPLTELAEAGQGILEKPPNSGTQPRMREELARIIGQALTGGGTVGGAAALSGMPPLLAGALGGGAALTTALAQPLRNAYTRSDIGQAMLGRQGPAFPQGSRAGLTSIMAAIQAAKQQQEAENEQLRRGGPR